MNKSSKSSHVRSWNHRVWLKESTGCDITRCCTCPIVVLVSCKPNKPIWISGWIWEVKKHLVTSFDRCCHCFFLCGVIVFSTHLHAVHSCYSVLSSAISSRQEVTLHNRTEQERHGVPSLYLPPPPVIFSSLNFPTLLFSSLFLSLPSCSLPPFLSPHPFPAPRPPLPTSLISVSEFGNSMRTRRPTSRLCLMKPNVLLTSEHRNGSCWLFSLSINCLSSKTWKQREAPITTFPQLEAHHQFACIV